MSTFENAIPVILKHEGGYVNNPLDHGGATNWGISTLIIQRENITAEELGIPDLTPESIKLMTIDAAKSIYKKLFWDKYAYGRIVNQNVATKIMDINVNCGVSRAHCIAQLASTDCGHPLTSDGILGSKSFAAINACDPTKLLKAMCARQLAYYEAIVAHNPTQSVFLRNWTKRSQWQG
jgi:lysozyme family protein